MSWETIAAAAITALAALAGTYFSNRKSSALLEYRMEQLEKKVDKHNQVIERTFKLEQRVDDLEKKAG